MIDGGLEARMEARLQQALRLEARTLEDHAQRRRDAVERIAGRNTAAIYGGLEIRPQRGLIPLGADPRSGLEEFALVETGEPPDRDAGGELVFTADSAIVLVLLPGGEFHCGVMPCGPTEGTGSARGPDSVNCDPWATPDEGRVHVARLRPFFLSKFEITQAQWLRLAGAAPSDASAIKSRAPAHTALQPVEQVDWSTCAEVLGRYELRLPHEEEWEYAARGGTRTVWWTGDQPESILGRENLSASDDHERPAPVGSFPANPFGLHDMLGNVREWCIDPWRGSYSRVLRLHEEPQFSVLVDGKHEPYRMVRGGSYATPPVKARCGRRRNFPPNTRFNEFGVRPLREPSR